MATLDITIPVTNGYTGSVLRRLAKEIEIIASAVPDRLTTGASTVLTFDNSPATGVASVQLSAGPYTSSVRIVG